MILAAIIVDNSPNNAVSAVSAYLCGMVIITEHNRQSQTIDLSSRSYRWLKPCNQIIRKRSLTLLLDYRINPKHLRFQIES